MNLTLDEIREAVRAELAVVQPPRLAYSEAEAAAMLGLQSHHLREQRRLGKIAFTRGPGGRILYRPEHIDEYLSDRETKKSGSDKG